MADAQLSGKLETAIQALDNITKVYYSFLNAEPMTPNFAATSDTRFDLHLVPYKVMTSVHDAMKRNYVGLSENIAGLIENILALKVCIIINLLSRDAHVAVLLIRPRCLSVRPCARPSACL